MAAVGSWISVAYPMDDFSGQPRIGPALERLAAGDDAARDELIAWATDRMRSIAHRMLRTFPTVSRWEQTDDVVQNAALRLDRALRDTVPANSGGLVGLAATQVRRELLDMAKKYRGPESYAANHETNYQRLDGELRAKVEDAAQAPEVPADLDRWTRLHTLAAELPEEERDVFQMCWYLGLKQDEIAQQLGCSVRTVKRRWEAAKQTLAAAMPGGSPD
jgi:RNA polymerase sigma factor (sigma-70 family)